MKRVAVAISLVIATTALTHPSAGAATLAGEASATPVLGAAASAPTDASRAMGQAPDRPRVAAGVIVKRSNMASQATARTVVADALGQVVDGPIGATQSVTPRISAYPTMDLLDESEALAAAESVAAQPGVEWAEPNWLARPAEVMPNPINDEFGGDLRHLWDKRNKRQLDVRSIGVKPWPPGGYSTKASVAWPATTGAGVVVAVVDTGIRPHPDLEGQILPGYDMISADPDGGTIGANDGDGRDPDPADPGDWVSAGLCGPGEAAEPSSWHGTAVAGIIAAIANNKVGIAGLAPNAKIVPVRVLGRCGGTQADIAAGIVWASGGTVPGVPANPNPALILNLSLGGYSACSATYATAIADARSRGALVIASAGNEDAAVGTPANCPGAMAVAATSPYGDKASYSSFGPEVAVSAFGGELMEGNDEDGVFMLSDSGTTAPAGPGYTMNQGTSMAAPMVASGAALVTALKGVLPPDTLRAELQAATVPFPTATSGWSGFSTCNTSACGTGVLDLSKLVPTVTGRPKISGKVQPGRVVTASTATWSGAPTTPSVTWMVNGTAVAEGPTYQVSVSDIGKTLTAFAHGTAPFAAIGATSKKKTVLRAAVKLRTKAKARNARGPGKRVRIVTKISVPVLPDHRPRGRVKVQLLSLKGKRVLKRAKVKVRASKRGKVAVALPRVAKGKYRLKVIYSGDKLVQRKARTMRLRVR